MGEHLLLNRSVATMLACCIGLLVVLSLVADAKAEQAPPLFWQKCETGSAFGDCIVPRGLAVDEDTGAVFVADQGNSRIVQLSVWGEFVKAWGWGVRTGASELETCTAQSGCRQGLSGEAPGQLSRPSGLAVDSAGDVYVMEPDNLRVQKFDPGLGAAAATLTLGIGGNVNRTNVEAGGTTSERNLCVAASGDVCQGGAPGMEHGQFSDGLGLSAYIAIGPGGQSLYVGDQNRVQVFEGDGAFKEEIPIPGETIQALAVDPSDGSLFVTLSSGLPFPENPVKSEVRKLGPTGAELCSAPVKSPRALALGATGLYLLDGGGYLEKVGEGRYPPVVVRKLGADCADGELAEDPDFSFEPGIGGESAVTEESTGLAVSTACGIPGVDLYLAKTATTTTHYVRSYGPNPPIDTCGPPPAAAPTITDQFAAKATGDSAVVQAEISPHFWPDTTYYVQYGFEDCRVPTACAEIAPASEVTLPASGDIATRTVEVELTGLKPDTAYHYRFIARSSGGGPIYGEDPDGDGPLEASPQAGIGGELATYPAGSLPDQVCPNQEFRLGAASGLPYCRAYEMVSPVDKEGGEIFTLPSTIQSNPASIDQASRYGGRFTYSSYRAFSNPLSAPITSQYMATRTMAGWATEPISPFQIGSGFSGASFDSNFKAFTEDLCSGWLLQPSKPLLAAGALDEYKNLYLRSNCVDPAGFEALTRTEPTYDQGSGPVSVPQDKFFPAVQGFSEDGAHTVFRSTGSLAGNPSTCTASGCTRQIFDVTAGQIAPVCVLPTGQPVTGSCAAGAAGPPEVDFRRGSVFRAVSKDGGRIFWTDETKDADELFVRIDQSETKRLTNQPTEFWTAAEDGSRVIYGIGALADSTLYEHDVAMNKRKLIADEVVGVMGASADATVVYYVSRQALSGDPNSQGEVAEPGEPNLYMHRGGGSPETFIATLSDQDVSLLSSASVVSRKPYERASRVSADGGSAVFTSSASLTGSDNHDLATGQPTTEVFLFQADAEALRCVSCNPTNARPQAQQEDGIWFGGSIPGWTAQYYPSRALADDGARVFFDSTESLVPEDTNEAWDVYEWDAGQTQQDCEAIGAQLFLKVEGGCLSLLSSGSGKGDSKFVDADGTGADVFIRTSASHVPQDPGQVDIYDLRAGGGFPPPPDNHCAGEECQPPPPAPPPAAAPSSTSTREGNVRPRNRRCPKGKHRVTSKKGVSRCVKSKKHKGGRRR